MFVDECPAKSIRHTLGNFALVQGTQLKIKKKGTQFEVGSIHEARSVKVLIF